MPQVGDDTPARNVTENQNTDFAESIENGNPDIKPQLRASRLRNVSLESHHAGLADTRN